MSARTVAELRPGQQLRNTDGHVLQVTRPAEEVSAEGEKVLAQFVTGPRAGELVDLFYTDIDWTHRPVAPFAGAGRGK